MKNKNGTYCLLCFFPVLPSLLSPLFKTLFRWIPKKSSNPKASFWFLQDDKIFSGKEFKVTDFYTKTNTCNYYRRLNLVRTYCHLPSPKKPLVRIKSLVISTNFTKFTITEFFKKPWYLKSTFKHLFQCSKRNERFLQLKTVK